MPSQRLLLTGALFLAGCGPSRSTSSAVHIDTLPSGALHVRSDAPLWKDGQGWRVAQDLAIGGQEEGPADFTDVRGVAVDGEGRIYVLDYQDAVVKVFDSSGKPVRTIGRRGSGPGEFTDLIGIGVHGSKLVAIDQGNVRVSLFDTSGSLITTHERHNPAGYNVGKWEGGVDTAGRIIEQLGLRVPGEPYAGFVLIALDSSFAAVDTFELPVFHGRMLTVERKNSRTSAFPRYSPRLSWVFDPRGSIWFGVSDKFQIVQRHLAGDTVRIVERAWTAESVSDSARQEALESLSWFTAQGGVASLSDIPTTKPAFGELVVDDVGNLWVGPYSPRNPWQVFDSSGQWLGPVDFPAPVQQLTIRGDRYYGVVRDSLDVVQVVRGSVERR